MNLKQVLQVLHLFITNNLDPFEFCLLWHCACGGVRSLRTQTSLFCNSPKGIQSLLPRIIVSRRLESLYPALQQRTSEPLSGVL